MCYYNVIRLSCVNLYYLQTANTINEEVILILDVVEGRGEVCNRSILPMMMRIDSDEGEIGRIGNGRGMDAVWCGLD